MDFTFTVASLIKMLSQQNQDAVVITENGPVTGVEIFGGNVKILTKQNED